MKTLPLLAAAVFGGTLGASAGAQAAQDPIGSLARAQEWINSPPLAAKDMRGKVVLVDFWTYTCINWIRTLPYVRAWAQKYKDQGLIVVGVHSPEFEFEKDLRNVRENTALLRVDFPVAVDSDHGIWNAYDNQYWPAVYLVDARGRVRFQHFGEGDYDRIEKEIQKLLAETGKAAPAQTLVSLDPQGAEAAADWDNLRSGENYLGSQRTQNFASPVNAKSGKPADYAVPARLSLNQWALSGHWTMTSDAVHLHRSNGRIAYRFHARDVNLVMGPATRGQDVKFRVLIDGKPPEGARGTDLDEKGFGVVKEPRMYQLIRQPGRITDRLIEIEFLDAGVQAFSFTFG